MNNILSPVFNTSHNVEDDIYNLSPAIFSSFALANGTSVDLPGPAAGFLRIYDFVQVNSNTVAGNLTLISCSLQPLNYTIVSGLSTTGGSTLTILVYTPIGNGETLRITNGGANSGNIIANYRDIPASGITLIRQLVTNVPSIIIPAPPSNRYRRFLIYPGNTSQSFFLFSRSQLYNADTVSTQYIINLGGILIQRSPAVVSAASSVPVSPVADTHVSATTGDMTISTVSVPTTNSPIFFGAYIEIFI